ncbi:hypothetical protein IF2G_02239 [Cordyceps javanica]|nr:hypothetical protein IF2G_02239 [Cordyceps javanica]
MASIVMLRWRRGCSEERFSTSRLDHQSETTDNLPSSIFAIPTWSGTYDFSLHLWRFGTARKYITVDEALWGAGAFGYERQASIWYQLGLTMATLRRAFVVGQDSGSPVLGENHGGKRPCFSDAPLAAHPLPWLRRWTRSLRLQRQLEPLPTVGGVLISPARLLSSFVPPPLPYSLARVCFDS